MLASRPTLFSSPNQIIELNTKVVNLLTQQKVSVFYKSLKAVSLNQPIRMNLYLSGASQSIGEIIVKKNSSELDPDNFDIFALPIVDLDYPEYFTIVDMRNLSPKQYKHVGIALYEMAFRESIQCGCSGRLIADAVRDSHAFHYKMGMRIRDMSKEKSAEEKQRVAGQYYGQIAEALTNGRMQKGKDLGKQYIFLPNHAIHDTAKKFELPADQLFDAAKYPAPSYNVRYPVEEMMALPQQQPEPVFDCRQSCVLF